MEVRERLSARRSATLIFRLLSVSTLLSARDRLIRYRRSRPRAPRLTARRDKTRGLEFAVFASPEVSKEPPLVCINGEMLCDHSSLWPALSPLGINRQLILRRDRYDWTKIVGAVIADVLVIHDERDLISCAVARELVALIAKSRLALLADVGHMPFWEAPEAFFVMVDSFLRAA